MQKNTQPIIKFAILATDAVLFAMKEKELLVRLVKIAGNEYFPNHFGLPGGLMDPKENGEEAVKRNTETKAGISSTKIYFEQLYTFSDVNRDPRGRVVALAYMGLLSYENLSDKESNDSSTQKWVTVKEALRMKLAYDHNQILQTAIIRLKARITYTTLIQKIMPKEFTLTELEKTYESILNTEIDKRNFRKKILGLKVLEEMPYKQSGVKFRPAQLYRFKKKDVVELEIF